MAKPYQFMTNFGSKKFLVNAYKEFLDHLNNNLNNEINLVSSMSSELADSISSAETIQDAAIQMSDTMSDDLWSNDLISQIRGAMGGSFNGLAALKESGYVSPFTYAKIQAIHSLMDDFDLDEITQQERDALASIFTKLRLDEAKIYPLSSTDGEARSLTLEDVLTTYDKDKPSELMVRLKESSITNSALSCIYDSYSGDDVEGRQSLDIAGFKTRVEAKLGCSIDPRLLNPAMQLLDTATKCPNSSIFLTIFNKMLNFSEDSGIQEDFKPSNNDFSQYTGSAWTGFLGMAGSVATVIGNAIATTGKCVFSVIGGAFLAINALAFKVLGAVVSAVTKFIYEIFDPIAIGIAKGSSATVEGFGVIGNSVSFQLSNPNWADRNWWYPCFTIIHPNAQCDVHFTKDRAKKLVGKWVYIETLGLKGLYKIESYNMRPDNTYLSSITLSYMVKPVALDIPTHRDWFAKIQTINDGYGRWNFNGWTDELMESFATIQSNSSIQKLEAQASGWSIENCLMTCLMYPFWMINSACYARLMKYTWCTDDASKNIFHSEVMNTWGTAGIGWDNAGAPIMDPGKLLEAIRHNSSDQNNSNLNNTDFVTAATGNFKTKTMWNWRIMYDSHQHCWRQTCFAPYTASYPIMPFLCFLDDLSLESDQTFIPYMTEDIGNWGVEQITIKTDAQLASSSLMKVVGLAAAITAVFVAPKLIGKVKQAGATKLKKAFETKTNLTKKMESGSPLSLGEKLSLKRANKRITKNTGVMSPIVTTQINSDNSVAEAQEELAENVDQISSRLF